MSVKHQVFIRVWIHVWVFISGFFFGATYKLQNHEMETPYQIRKLSLCLGLFPASSSNLTCFSSCAFCTGASYLSFLLYMLLSLLLMSAGGCLPLALCMFLSLSFIFFLFSLLFPDSSYLLSLPDIPLIFLSSYRPFSFLLDQSCAR